MDDCISMLAHFNSDEDVDSDGAIVMSNRFAEEYQARVGAREFAMRTTTTKGGWTLILWPKDPGPE